MNKKTLIVIGVGIGVYLLFFSRKARCYHILNTRPEQSIKEKRYKECLEGKQYIMKKFLIMIISLSMLGCGITEPTKKSCCDKKSSTEKCETKK